MNKEAARRRLIAITSFIECRLSMIAARHGRASASIRCLCRLQRHAARRSPQHVELRHTARYDLMYRRTPSRLRHRASSDSRASQGLVRRAMLFRRSLISATNLSIFVAAVDILGTALKRLSSVELPRRLIIEPHRPLGAFAVAPPPSAVEHSLLASLQRRHARFDATGGDGEAGRLTLRR